MIDSEPNVSQLAVDQPEMPAERFERLSRIVLGMAWNMRPADEDVKQEGLLKLWELFRGQPQLEDK